MRNRNDYWLWLAFTAAGYAWGVFIGWVVFGRH